MLSKPSLIIFKRSINPWHLCFYQSFIWRLSALVCRTPCWARPGPPCTRAGGAGVLGGRRFDDHFRLHHRFRPGQRPPERALGTGRVTAISAATTAAALFGFSFCHAFWQLCLWAVPYGLGAGSVDAAFNNYVALHYKSRHMSWLHCMWGLGASLGPVIMGQGTGRFRLAGRLPHHCHVAGGADVVLLFQPAAVEAAAGPLWVARRSPRSTAAFRSCCPVCRKFWSAFCVTAHWNPPPGCGPPATAPWCAVDAGTAASWASLFYWALPPGGLFPAF